MSRKPAHHHHTGGFGGLGNMKFPGGKSGGGGQRKPHHHHTGGFGGLGNTKFPGKKPPRKMPGGKIVTKPKHPKRGLAWPSPGGWWITGGNDAADNCAAVAVANSLLAATGRRLDDAELLRLHDRAGPLSIPEALAAAREIRELAAVDRDAARLVSEHHGQLQPLHFGQLEQLDHVAVALLDDHAPVAAGPVNGNGGHAGRRDPALVFIHSLIVGLATPHGPHAALLLGESLVTWGGVMDWPDDWLLEEAWEVRW
jgi:hypothetical protein